MLFPLQMFFVLFQMRLEKEQNAVGTNKERVETL